ncbi:hypothetical protein HDF11_004828 [Tunturiibacter psychrotolerans]
MHINLDLRLIAGVVFLATTLAGSVALYFYVQKRRRDFGVATEPPNGNSALNVKNPKL